MSTIAQLKITPYLWFNGQAEAAAEHYVGIFPDSKIGSVSRYGENGPMAAGTVITATIWLCGQPFYLLNGGPEFSFTEAVSFLISCDDQTEVDYYWAKLADGGSEGRCGWLKDRFGLSWQVVPTALGQLMSDPDAEKAGRVMQAMMKMNKIIVNDLKQAYDQGNGENE